MADQTPVSPSPLIPVGRPRKLSGARASVPAPSRAKAKKKALREAAPNTACWSCAAESPVLPWVTPGLQILQIPAAARVPGGRAQLRCVSPRPGSLKHHKTALGSAPLHPTAPRTFPTLVTEGRTQPGGCGRALPAGEGEGTGGAPAFCSSYGRLRSQRRGPHHPGCSSSRGGSGCFLAEPEAGGPRREEGAPQLPPGSSRHVQWLRSQAELSFPSGNNRIPSPFGRGASPPARACGWAAVSGDRPAGSGHPGGKESPEKHKRAAGELPERTDRVCGVCTVPRFTPFSPCEESTGVGRLRAAVRSCPRSQIRQP